MTNNHEAGRLRLMCLGYVMIWPCFHIQMAALSSTVLSDHPSPKYIPNERVCKALKKIELNLMLVLLTAIELRECWWYRVLP